MTTNKTAKTVENIAKPAISEFKEVKGFKIIVNSFLRRQASLVLDQQSTFKWSDLYTNL
jgi:hypothetical protein